MDYSDKFNSKERKDTNSTNILFGTCDDFLLIKNTLTEMEREYNKIPQKEFLKGYDYFWKCHKYILQLETQGCINILKADCSIAHLSEIMNNDGPEYAAVIEFCLVNHKEQKYKIGVCVRGAPMFRKCH